MTLSVQRGRGCWTEDQQGPGEPLASAQHREDGGERPGDHRSRVQEDQHEAPAHSRRSPL